MVVSNLAWALLGKFVNLLSGLVVGVIVARFLGPEQYGLMNYVISFVFFFQIIASFGLDNIEIREEAKNSLDRNIIIGTSLVIRLLLGIICVILCIITSSVMDADCEVISLVTLYASTILFNSLIVARNYFYAIVKNKRVVQSEVIRTFICLLLKIVLLLLEAPLIWFMVTCVLDVIIVQIGYVMAYRHDVGKIEEWKFDKKYAKYLLREAFPLLLTSAAVMVYQRVDQVMIGQLVDKESVGYFSVASRLVEVLLYLPMIMAQTLSPILTKALHNDRTEFLVKGQKFMDISIWASLICSVLMALCSYWAVSLLFGEAYLPAVAILQVLAFKTVSVALSNTAGTMLVVEGLQKYAILRDGTGCVACVALNIILLPRYGVMASAFIALVSNVFAGYIVDALVPSYRHLFVMQTKALLFGWKNVVRDIKTGLI